MRYTNPRLYFILKTNEPISVQIGTSGPGEGGGKGMHQSTSGSKVKVIGSQSYIWRPGRGIILETYNK